MELKLGDRVRIPTEEEIERLGLDAISMREHARTFGKSGSIVKLYTEFTRVGIKFDDDIKGHNCNGLGEVGYCWNVDRRIVFLENSKAIEDTSMYRTTIDGFQTNDADWNKDGKPLSLLW